jgi:hypothetical protein
LISGNNGTGAFLGSGRSNYSSFLRFNIIGADVTGTQPLGNQGDGVSISINSADDLSDPTVTNNLIAYNTGAGVRVPDTNPALITKYYIRENRIFANGGLGIDIFNEGVTSNDPGDTDGDLWGVQNFPELNTASVGSTVVNGRLYSNEGDTYRIQVFTNDSCDPSGYGEGQTFIGETSVTVNQSDVGLFSLTVPPLQAGQYLTATASLAGTSEFSRCVRVMPGPPAPTLRYPLANITISDARPALSWNAVPNARRSHLQLARTVDFSAMIADTFVASTASAPATILPGYYYWRVQVQTTAGIWSPYSEVRSFTYAIMNSPLPDKKVFSHTPPFTWNAYPRVQRYQLQVDNNADFSSPEAVCVFSHRVLSSGPCGIPGGLPFGNYYWRVNIDLRNGFIVSPIAWPVTLIARP